jgi:cellulose synthase/poly-beta-1,6-N-acetylglucosamine synthase-like glycosyltransferase
MQNAEYIFGIALRHSLSSVNGLYVTPGPFSFYRSDIFRKLGGFRHGHSTEDMEMALRIQQAGFKIGNAPRARVYTKAPYSLPGLLKQRTRWTTGFIKNIFGDYWHLVGNRSHGVLGMIVLPTALVAIVSGITLFCIAILKTSLHIVTLVQTRSGIPLSYSLVPHMSISLDWFYVPSSFYFVLAVITVLASLGLIAVGKRISQTPGNLAFGVISYALLYGLIVPIWLLRATTDVARGIERSWR